MDDDGLPGLFLRDASGSVSTARVADHLFLDRLLDNPEADLALSLARAAFFAGVLGIGCYCVLESRYIASPFGGYDTRRIH